MADSFS